MTEGFSNSSNLPNNVALATESVFIRTGEDREALVTRVSEMYDQAMNTRHDLSDGEKTVSTATGLVSGVASGVGLLYYEGKALWVMGEQAKSFLSSPDHTVQAIGALTILFGVTTIGYISQSEGGAELLFNVAASGPKFGVKVGEIVKELAGETIDFVKRKANFKSFMESEGVLTDKNLARRDLSDAKRLDSYSIKDRIRTFFKGKNG